MDQEIPSQQSLTTQSFAEIDALNEKMEVLDEGVKDLKNQTSQLEDSVAKLKKQHEDDMTALKKKHEEMKAQCEEIRNMISFLKEEMKIERTLREEAEQRMAKLKPVLQILFDVEENFKFEWESRYFLEKAPQLFSTRLGRPGNDEKRKEIVGDEDLNKKLSTVQPILFSLEELRFCDCYNYGIIMLYSSHEQRLTKQEFLDAIQELLPNSDNDAIQTLVELLFDGGSLHKFNYNPRAKAKWSFDEPPAPHSLVPN
jgi:hypothetical protein